MNNQVTSIDIPVLSDGVTTQPESLRFPSQVEDASNVRFDVRSGASKRPGTMLVSEYGSTFQSNQVLAMHPIDRSSSEQYLVIYGRNTGGFMQIEVFDTDGNAAIVNCEGATYTPGSATSAQQPIEDYLASGTSSADDLRMRTIIDSTFIVNTLVATSPTSTPSYDLTRSFQTYEEMLRHTPANDSYHETRVDSSGSDSGNWQYSAGSATFAVFVCNPAVTTDWFTPANWTNARYGFRVGFIRHTPTLTTGYTFTNSGKTLNRTNGFTDYTFSEGDKIQITSGTGVTAGWYTIASKDSDDQITLDTNIGGTNPTDVAFYGIGREYQVEVDYTGTSPSTYQQIAQDLTDSLRSAGSPDGVIEWVDGDGNQGYFVITGDYRGAESEVLAPTAPQSSTARTVSDLTASGSPFNAGTGSAGTSAVSVGSDQVRALEDRWTRVSAPGQSKGALQSNTNTATNVMPVRLVRTNTSPLTFDLQRIDWSQRIDGDQDSNPVPTPFDNGDTVNDLVFFEGRLGLAVGEYMVFSRVDDLFDFYVEDVDNLKDDDRIVVPVGSTRVSKLKHVVPSPQKTLILFSEDAQYELQGGSNGLSPTSVSVTEATGYRSTDVPPVSMKSFVYFVGEREKDSAIYEYFFDDSAAANFAGDITAHVQGYLPTGITGMTSDSVQNAIVACRREDSDVYVYRAFWNGNQKVQSAWCRYDFDDNYDIADVASLGGKVYMLLETGSRWRLEYLPMSDEAAPSGFQYAPRSDVRITATPTHAAGVNTFNVSPLNAVGSTLNTLVTQDGTVYTAGVNSTWTYTGGGLGATELSVQTSGNDDLSGGPCILGRFFDMELTLSRPYAQDERGQRRVHDRVFLRDLFLDHVESGKYQVQQSRSQNFADGTTTVTSEFDPPGNAITDSLGHHRHVIRGDADLDTLKVVATDPTPCTITQGQYIVEIVAGGRFH